MSAQGADLPPPTLPEPQSEQQPARTWRWVLLGVGITVAVIIAGLVALGAYVVSQPLMDDDMNRGDGPFIAESDPLVDLRYEDGAYVMDLAAREGGNVQTSRSFWQPSRRSVDLSITYEVREAPGPESHYGVSLGCVASGGTYWLSVEGSGHVGLYLDSPDDTQFVPKETVLPDKTQSGRLRLVCQDAGGDAQTRLIGYFDDQKVLSTEDSIGYGSFRAIAIRAGTLDDNPMTVHWDDAYAD